MGLVLTLGALVVGCGDGTPEADFTFVSGSEHNTLDPQRMSWVHDIRLAGQMFDPLVSYNFEAGEAEPAAAASWEVSDDRKTYTFHLREGAKWSNGDPVKASDYIYAWRRAMMPDFAADYTTFMYHIKGAKAFYAYRSDQLEKFQQIRKEAQASGQAGSGVEAAKATWQSAKARFDETVGLAAPDAHTLKVTLKRPVPYFLQLVAFATYMPVHPPSVKAATNLSGETGRLQMDSGYWSDPDRLVTNGPYQMTGRAFKRYVLLEANPHYWNREAMRNDSILERIVPDTQSQLLMESNGQVDWLPDIPAQQSVAADLVQQDRDDVHVRPLAGTYFYNFNCQETLPDGSDNPLTDPKVRRALSLAIDREAIVEHVTQLGQPIARTFIPPTALANYEPPVDAGVTFDPEKARDLLAEAGHANGEGLDGLSILYATKKGHGKIAQAVRGDWSQHLGVSVELEAVRDKTFADRLDNGEFSIARAAWIGDYPDPTTWLNKMRADSNNNDARWHNKQYDALLDKAEDQHGERRRQTLRQAERLLVREQPMAMLFHYVSVDVYDPERVKGLNPGAWPRWELERVRVVSPGEADQ